MWSLGARLVAWLFGLLLLIGTVWSVGAEQAVPKLGARVSDLTGTLTADQKDVLEAKLAGFERQKGAQIAVLIVSTVAPESIEQYAMRVVEAWKLGRRGVDDGALLLVAKQDRKLRIEVGYGLEGALNDAIAKRIISETIGPRFVRGEFFAGIDAGLDAMIKVIGGEALPAPAASSGGTSADDNMALLMAVGFMLVFVFGRVLRAVLGRFLAAAVVGLGAGVIAAMLLSSLLLAVIAGVVAFFVSLLFGTLSSAGWSSGVSSWGSGGGGGGFSGGGGGFGGGGASGDW
ncbi:MAG TPA: TPM domain-containing protein [Accumulibacter sp.]|jgi:uncharacterized protein|nr:TPM domain-containing protein [Accumulibacter sp.]HQC79994.1 TPM domain-containing protein [Accumulibacter sp.]